MPFGIPGKIRLRKERHISATQKVLNTYELLESVLLHLRTQDVRQARLVSRLWHAVVTNSQTLTIAWLRSHKYRIFNLYLCGDADACNQHLIIRWVCGVFPEYVDPTIDDTYRRQIEVDGEKWLVDASYFVSSEEGPGHAPLRSLRPDSSAFALTYSVESRRSFDRLDMFMNMINQHFQDGTSNKPPLLGLLATKCDLQAQPGAVSSAEGENLANVLGVPFFTASAKLGTNVDETFTALVRAYRGPRLDSVPESLPPLKRRPYDLASPRPVGFFKQLEQRLRALHLKPVQNRERKPDEFISKIGPCPRL